MPKSLRVLPLFALLAVSVACAFAFPTSTPTPTPTPKASCFDVDSPEGLRAYFDRAREELKLVMDEDIAVKFIPRETNIDTCAAATMYHIPSMSSVDIGYDGVVGGCCLGRWVEGKRYWSEEGAARLEAVIADESLMQRVRARIEGIQGQLLPERERDNCEVHFIIAE